MENKSTELAHNPPFCKTDVSGSLPSLDDATKVAVRISEAIKPPLDTKEQAMFIAGFQECIKWLTPKISTKDNQKNINSNLPNDMNKALA